MLNNRLRTRILVAMICLISAWQPLLAGAQAAVDYEYLISDAELVAYQAMGQTDIQRFLESKGSYLSNYFMPLDTGERVSAGELIFRAAQNHRINPQFLLALLQKEQGLVEEVTPKQTQLDWATGYGCFDNQPCNERWRGFHKQINSAAEQFRYYYEHISEYNFRPGKASSVDGQTIVPQNIVTAAMYNYTPHLQGNALFKALWDKYFVTLLPDGTVVKVEGDPGVWLLANGVKRAFTSNLALVSRYNPNLIVPISKSDLDSYDRGPDIEFAAYSLLRNATTGTIYLLTADQKRAISSMEVFKTLGFNPEEVEEATDAQLMAIPDGRPVTLSDAYPTGSVLQDKATGKLFYVESGRKYPIIDKAILAVNFPAVSVTKVAASLLDKYANGLPVQFKEGALVKGSGSEVYVISNQRKRHITSEKVFTTIGYKWSNIVVAGDDALSLHPTGDPIELSN
ncbi:MAG: hypothetical protein HY422_03695 [Candidatus Komeilibacteria bacterium]|nr:hypothetical protein [Candidatus Komeilibacteria bacterium]